MKNKYTVLDLFCGCGGLSYGFMQAGFKILLGIDTNEIALNTYKVNHPESQVLCKDIEKANINEIRELIGNKEIDIIIGGPPCQGMSLSGPRKFDDPRNRLYLSYIHMVEVIRPKAFVIENVPGLVGLFKGQIKTNIIERLSALGYNVNFKILNSSEYGVPQARRRVIFVGVQKGYFDFNTLHKRDEITCEMALSDLPPLETELGNEKMEYASEPLNDYQEIMRKGSKEVLNHIAAKHSDHVKHIISLVPDGGNYKDLPEEYRTTRNFHVAWTRFRSDRPAPTIDTGHRHHFHYKYNRVPTVRECARLQSFPDTFVFTGNKTQQFLQVGNAVPPILAQTIAEALKNNLENNYGVPSSK